MPSSNPVFIRFAAIDFETADYGRDSACSLAVVIVDNASIVERLCYLIKPPRKNFVFSHIHGIQWPHVEDKPSFKEIWDDIQPYLNGVHFIAAHNASFDRSVLNSCCTMIGSDCPVKPYLCTMQLARSVWNIYPTKLPDVCKKLKIALKHHDAASDALACANIVIQAAQQGYSLSQFLSYIDKKIPA